MRSASGSALLPSIAVLLLLPPAAARAAEEPPLPSPLPLEALLSAVRRHAPSLIERRRAEEAASLRPAALGRPADPVLSLEWWQQPVNFQAVPLMVTARQAIPWPGTLSREREVGEREARLSADDTGAELLRVEAVARRAFFELGLAEESLAVNQRMLAIGRHLVEVTQAQYRVGRATQVDVLRAQSELLVTESQRFDLDRDVAAAAARLNGLLDRPAAAPIGPAGAVLVAGAPVPSRQDLVDAALAHRPDLARARHRVEAALARRQLAEREGRPALEAWAGYMAMVGGTDAFTLGVSSTMPVWSRGRRAALVRVEEAEADAARAELAGASRRAEVEIEVALREMEAASRHMRLHGEQLVPLADRALESAEASYVAGRLPASEMLASARAAREHHLDHLRFRADYRRRRADLEEAVGVPLSSLERAADGEGGRP